MNAVTVLKEKEAVMRQNFHVCKIGVFGSYARGENSPASDIDVLVEFEPGHKTFDNFMDLQFYLEELFGKKIDLVTNSALKPQLKDDILNDVIYA
ncbi:MAG: nucleotidyltransferase family protein [Nitrospira sp.]|nr:nucleotidyltransferase family protein [bacterium]MBL7048634.1 nucleotidyltransferase family protein [Nitrospira sp.]